MKTIDRENILQNLKNLDDNLLQVLYYQAYDQSENLVLIFEDEHPSLFDLLQPLMHCMRRRHLGSPLVLNRLFIEGSLDSYPLEFLNMQTSFQNLLCNSEIIKNLSFAKPDLRLQMERELRSKWLLTRQAVLDNPYKIGYLHKVILASRSSIHPVLKGFFALAGQDVPPDLLNAVNKGKDITGCDLEPMHSKVSHPSDVAGYLVMLQKLIGKIQDWKL